MGGNLNDKEVDEKVRGHSKNKTEIEWIIEDHGNKKREAFASLFAIKRLICFVFEQDIVRAAFHDRGRGDDCNLSALL